MTENTQKLIIEHYNTYPNANIKDFFKFLHQSSFGCEHIITDCGSAVRNIETEFEKMQKHEHSDNFVSYLDGEYVRVDLGYLYTGLSAKTLGKLLFLSAKKEENGQNELNEKLAVFKKMIETGILPFCIKDYEKEYENWKKAGFSAIHHSDRFREEYDPHYRVISKDLAFFLPFFAKVDSLPKNQRNIVAIEGGSACGKTSLGKILEKVYDCTVLHTDDFFLRPEQRTPERFAEAGGNIDRERLLDEIFLPLKENKALNYRKFDCSTFSLTSPVSVDAGSLVFVEGAYSMHPAFQKYYSLSLFIDIDENTQKERILNRNTPSLAKRFFSEWIPLEKTYFDSLNIKERCTLKIDVSQYKEATK